MCDCLDEILMAMASFNPRPLPKGHFAFPYRGASPLAEPLAPSLFWAKIPAYLCLAVGGVFTSVLAYSLASDSACSHEAAYPHAFDAMMYVVLSCNVGALGMVSSNGIARSIRARVRTTSWLTTTGCVLLTLVPIGVALGVVFGLGSYFCFQDLYPACID